MYIYTYIYHYYDKRNKIYTSCFETQYFTHDSSFNKYEIKFMKRFLYHLIGKLIHYNFILFFR